VPKINLTQAAVEKLPSPSGSAITYWDSNLAGFGIRVSPKGRKTFVAQYRVVGGGEVVETIATMAVLPSVAEARQRARHSMLKAKEGINPVVDRRQRQAAERAAAAAQALTFEKLATRYIAEYAEPNCKPRSASETDRLLKRASRFFGDRPVHLITKGDVLDLIQPSVNTKKIITSAGGRSEATNLLKAVRRTIHWAIEHELLTTDPTLGVSKPLIKTTPRDRVLDDEEIVKFWHGCEAIGYPFGPLFQLLLLTGQRLREVGELPRPELDLDPGKRIWHLPKERAKNRKASDIHLSDAALAVIVGLPRVAPLAGKPEWLFSVTGTRPVSGYWCAKKQVAAMMGVSDWALHDLRRTATTIMARLGVAPHVADRVLNHTGGTIRGVAAVYNRFDYRDERAAALDKLGRFVIGLVHSDTPQGNAWRCAATSAAGHRPKSIGH
jgi:integrase